MMMVLEINGDGSGDFYVINGFTLQHGKLANLL
jgi:hypothetical protein